MSPDGREAAVSVTLVPTFDAIAPQDAFEILEDEKPVQLFEETGANFHFLFVVDRSGSMNWYDRMRIAREALDIFIRSLPPGCTFSIISFGSPYYMAMKYLRNDGGDSTCMVNDDICKEYAL